MTSVRTIAAHDVVRHEFPREPTERDRLGMATGKAIDAAVSRLSHEVGQGRRPTQSALGRFAEEQFDREVEAEGLEVPAVDRATAIRQSQEVLRAFRRSELCGLPRPKSRLVLIDDDAGIYVQPDFWNGGSRIYEMKTYRAVPLPPDVELQLHLFQLGFPSAVAYIACFDRHVTPVATYLEPVPPPDETRRAAILEHARTLALTTGMEKVLEYVDAPIVRYTRSV